MGIMKMTELRDTSLDMLDKVDIDAQNHCSESSKPDAKALRWQTVFWQPHNKTETEVIFSKDLSTGQAVEAVVVATEMTPLPPPVEKTTHEKVHQVFRCAQKIEQSSWPFAIESHGHQHLNTLARTASTSLILWHGCCVDIQMTRQCLQTDLHCPTKSTGTSSQLLKISCTAFQVDGRWPQWH